MIEGAASGHARTIAQIVLKHHYVLFGTFGLELCVFVQLEVRADVGTREVVDVEAVVALVDQTGLEAATESVGVGRDVVLKRGWLFGVGSVDWVLGL